MSPNERAVRFAECLWHYHRLGWKVIPIYVYWGMEEGKLKRLKKTPIQWQEFQDRSPTDEEVERWCCGQNADKAGIAFITGEYSPDVKVTVLDYDQKDGKPNLQEDVDELTDTMWSRTASGSLHYYFQHNLPDLRSGSNLRNGSKDAGDTLIDMKAAKSLIVVGPTPLWSYDPRRSAPEPEWVSNRPSGPPVVLGEYTTPQETLLSPYNLPTLPTKFSDLRKVTGKNNSGKWMQFFAPGLIKAARNPAVISLAGKMSDKVTNTDTLEKCILFMEKLIDKKLDATLEEKVQYKKDALRALTTFVDMERILANELKTLDGPSL